MHRKLFAPPSANVGSATIIGSSKGSFVNAAIGQHNYAIIHENPNSYKNRSNRLMIQVCQAVHEHIRVRLRPCRAGSSAPPRGFPPPAGASPRSSAGHGNAGRITHAGGAAVAGAEATTRAHPAPLARPPHGHSNSHCSRCLGQRRQLCSDGSHWWPNS